jgi:hypothetical protein
MTHACNHELQLTRQSRRCKRAPSRARSMRFGRYHCPTLPRCQTTTSATLGVGFRASETFIPERRKRDALFCSRLTNDAP